MSLSGWVSNANEGHDKDMGHKLIEEKLKTTKEASLQGSD